MNKTFCTGILIPCGCGSNGNMNCALHDESVACATLEGRTEILTNVFFHLVLSFDRELGCVAMVRQNKTRRNSDWMNANRSPGDYRLSSVVSGWAV